MSLRIQFVRSKLAEQTFTMRKEAIKSYETIDNKFIKKRQSQYLNKIKILVNLLHKELKTKLDELIFTIFPLIV